jgi:hypothetical protein
MEYCSHSKSAYFSGAKKLPLGRRKKQGAVNATNVFILFLFLKTFLLQEKWGQSRHISNKKVKSAIFRPQLLACRQNIIAGFPKNSSFLYDL